MSELRERPGRAPPSAVVEWALIAGGLGVLFFLLPHELAGDGLARFADLTQLRHGHLTEDKYSLVMPLFSAPVLLLGHVVRSEQWWAARFNVVVVAAGILVAHRLLRDRVDARLYRQLVLVLLFASLLANRLRDYYGEVFTATLVAVGIAALLTGRRSSGWTAMIVGVANQPAAIVPFALVAAAEAVRVRRLRMLVPVAIGAAAIMGENWLRRGGPLATGYGGDHGAATVLPYSGRPGFSYPFVLGVVSILFSFGRGLAFFMPGLLLGFGRRTWQLARSLRYALVLLLLFSGGLVLAYAKWWAWYGGVGWGPRFFLIATVPASLFLALRLRHAGNRPLADLVTLLVLVASAWIGISGAIADHVVWDVCTRRSYALESLCLYVPDYSTLWAPFLRFPHLTTSTAVVAALGVLVFAYLAAPLVASLARVVREARPPTRWIASWRL